MSILLDKQYSPEEMAELRAQLNSHKAEQNLTWEILGKGMDVNKATLSLWATDKYTGNNTAIAIKVEKYFAAEEVQLQLLDERPIVPGFQPTKTAGRIYNMVSHARTGKFVILMGHPGVGKTVGLERACSQVPNAWHITASPSCRTMTLILKKIAGAITGTIPSGGGSLHLSNIIRDRVRGVSAVIIVDEAQNLDNMAIEELRSIYDDTRCGLLLAGNPEVLRKVEGDKTAAFAQRFSRVSMRHLIERPDHEDVESLLTAWAVANAVERKYLTDIAMKRGGGALRTMSQVLELATMLASIRDDETRSMDDLKGAWAQLSYVPGIAA